MEGNQKNQIVIYGGSFNPPLNSHLYLAQNLLNNFKQISKIIFVPVNCKYKKEGLINNEDRFNMLNLACNNNKCFEVSRLEIDSDRPLYTIETLNYFKKIYFPNDVAYVMGSDNLKDLPNWNKFEEICQNFEGYIIKRKKDKIDSIISSNPLLLRYQKNFKIIEENVYENLSSTYTRNLIKQNKSIRYLLPEKVENYIYEHNLYK